MKRTIVLFKISNFFANVAKQLFTVLSELDSYEGYKTVREAKLQASFTQTLDQLLILTVLFLAKGYF